MSRHLIYGLIDPRDLLIHYVGRSSDGMQRPMTHARNHRRSSHHGVRTAVWIADLRSSGHEYAIVVLERIEKPRAPSTRCWWLDDRNPTELPAAEQWWIAYGRACGWPLTNMTAGGDGVLGYRPSRAQREANSERMRAWWEAHPEARAVIAEQTRRRMLGHTKSPETCAKLAVPKSPETRRRMVAARARQIAQQREARPPGALSVAELAQVLHCGETGLRRSIVRGRVAAIRHAGQLLITAAEVRRVLADPSSWPSKREKLTADNIQEMLARRAAGETHEAIAARFGVNRATISYALKRHTKR